VSVGIGIGFPGVGFGYYPYGYGYPYPAYYPYAHPYYGRLIYGGLLWLEGDRASFAFHITRRHGHRVLLTAIAKAPLKSGPLFVFECRAGPPRGICVLCFGRVLGR